MTDEPVAAGGDAGYLGEALELAKRLNRLRSPDGRRLAAMVEVEGFEPWWFLDEHVMWYLLVPYVRHRSTFRRLLRGEPPPDGEPPESLATALQILKADLPAGAASGVGRRPARRRSSAVWLSRAGLALVSAASLLLFRWRRKTTLLYILDQVSPGLRHDFRLDPIYRELRSRGYRFAEYAHLRGLRGAYGGAWRNLSRRRRPVLFHEVLAGLAWRLRPARPPEAALTVDLGGRSDEELFLSAVARWRLRQSHRIALQIPILTAILRFQKVDRAVILDDSRHASMLVAACKLAGIPTLGYMHGLFNRYHTGLMAFGFSQARSHAPDLHGVWSEYFRQRLFEGDLYDEAGTAACGPLRAPAAGENPTEPSPPADDAPIRVLLVSEPRAAQDEIRPYLEHLLADPRFQVAVKLRPGEVRPHISAALGSSLEEIRTGTVYEAFARADLVIGTYSSVLYEAVMAQLPVVVLETSFTYGHEIAENAVAEFAADPREVCDVVAAAAALDGEELARRRRVVWGEGPRDGARTLFDLAESRLWPPPDRPAG